MRITDFLRPEQVVADLRATGKSEVLSEMTAHLARQDEGLVYADILRTLEERELLASTAIGEGIAIPHGKVEGLQGLKACLGRSVSGVNFDSMDGQPTHFLFLLLAPEHSTGGHLKALARIIRLFKNPAFRDRLMQAKDAAEIYSIVADEDAKF